MNEASVSQSGERKRSGTSGQRIRGPQIDDPTHTHAQGREDRLLVFPVSLFHLLSYSVTHSSLTGGEKSFAIRCLLQHKTSRKREVHAITYPLIPSDPVHSFLVLRVSPVSGRHTKNWNTERTQGLVVVGKREATFASASHQWLHLPLMQGLQRNV